MNDKINTKLKNKKELKSSLEIKLPNSIGNTYNS